MKRGLTALAVVVVALGPGVAVAAGQDIQVVNSAGLPDALVTQMEQAVQQQVNGPVDQAYPSAPQIDFVTQPTGDFLHPSWTVNLVPAAQWTASTCPSLVAVNSGCHWEEFPPVANVEVGGGGDMDLATTERTFSHEVIEMTVDPDGSAPEICDPVQGQSSVLDGVTVSDFVEPNGTAWSIPPAATAPTPSARAAIKHHRYHGHHRRHHRRHRRR